MTTGNEQIDARLPNPKDIMSRAESQIKEVFGSIDRGEITDIVVELGSYFDSYRDDDGKVIDVEKMTDDEVKNHARIEKFGDIIADFRKAIDAHGITDGMTEAEIQRFLADFVSKHGNASELFSPIAKLFKTLANSGVLKSLTEASKLVRAFSPEASEIIDLKNCPAQTLKFLMSLAGKPLTPADLIYLYPFIKKLILNPGQKNQKDTSVGYMNLGVNLSEPLPIMILDRNTNRNITYRTSYQDDGTLIIKKSENSGSRVSDQAFVPDLTVMASVRRQLFDLIVESMGDCITNSANQNELVFGIRSSNFVAQVTKIKEISDVLSQQLEADGVSIDEDLANEPLTAEEIRSFEDLGAKSKSKSISQAEQKILINLIKRILRTEQEGSPMWKSAQDALLKTDNDDPLSDNEKNRFNHLVSKSQFSSITTREMNELEELIGRILKTEQRGTPLWTKATEAFERTSMSKQPDQRLLMQEMFGGQKVQINQVLLQIKGRIDSLKELMDAQAGGPAKSQERDLRLYVLAENFIRNSGSLTIFVQNFYRPLLDDVRANLIKSYADSGKSLPDDEKLKDEVAVLALKEIELMLQHIVVAFYEQTIEAGGEPDEVFSTASSKAYTSFGMHPVLLMNTVSKLLTGLKTEAAQLKRNPGSGKNASLGESLQNDLVFFAKAVRNESNIKTTRDTGVRKILSNQIDYERGNSLEDLQLFTTQLEREFEVFDRAIIGSYNMRFLVNTAGNFFGEIVNPNGIIRGAVRSEVYDIVNQSADGEKVAQLLPTVKAIIMDYFNERGWILGQEMPKEAYQHPQTIFNRVIGFIHESYPEMSDIEQKKIAYLAVAQAYGRFMYHEMFSKNRPQSGFQGESESRDNAVFDINFNARKFAYGKPSDVLMHKAWARGVESLPAWFKDNTRYTMDGNPNINKRIENLDWTAPYGAIIEHLSGQYGHFLTYTDEHFDGTVPRSMLPYNLFDTGSDDKYRGWRQMSKSVGNISTSLIMAASGETTILLNRGYKDADHLTNVWKSLENVGINYLRTAVEYDSLGLIPKAVGKEIKDEKKYEHFYSYLYRRYFTDGPDGSHGLPNGFRSKSLAGVHSFGDVHSEADFWAKIKELIIKGKRSDVTDMFWSLFTVMLAERNPMVFLTSTNTWITQTGENLWQTIRKKYRTHELWSVNGNKSTLDDNSWDSARSDLIYVQSEARGRVTKQIRSKRASWETGRFDRNIFGDFRSDYSDVSLDERGTKGYVITTDVVRAILREKYRKIGLSSEEATRRLDRAVALYSDILELLHEKPNLPDYGELLGTISKNLVSTKITQKNDETGQATTRSRLLGMDSEDAYKKRYSKIVKTRAQWFEHIWKNRYLGVEPEMDFAEDLTNYQNADKEHVRRMADMVQATSIYAKDQLGKPNEEHSLTEQAKNFAKDPIKTIDGWSSFLNQFRKIVEDQLGPDPAARFMSYYMSGIIDASLKEERFRGGLSVGGFMGLFNEVSENVFGFAKTSLTADRNQYFTSKPLGSREASKVIRYMIQKKLLHPTAAIELRKRLRATISDQVWEWSPYLAIFLTVALGAQAVKSFSDEFKDSFKKGK
jgi:hypothetical protein